MRRAPTFASEGIVAECLALVAPAEAAFTSRWRLSTLQRLDPDLHDAVEEQRSLYDTAMLTGTDAEAREQAAAMVRGWRAACARLEQPLQPDDAYMVGWDSKTGLEVVIGDHPQSVARVQPKPGVPGINRLFVTPDEVARMMAGLNMIQSCKSAFPDAELIEIYPDEAA